MDKLRETIRLNLALELVSECAGWTDIDSVSRLVGSRLRRLFDADMCILVMRMAGDVRWLGMGPGNDEFIPLLTAEGGPRRALAEQTMVSGTPAMIDHPLFAIAHPLGHPGQPLGALCIHGPRAYSHQDLRFLHHVCTGLGAALLRIAQSAELASALMHATVSARAARDDAQAANVAKDTFLAMLGHELRNPLASISAAAELLRFNVPEAAQASVGIVQRQARLLDRMVSDLLDVSCANAGKVNLHRSVIDLRDVALTAAETTQPRIVAKGQRLTMRLPEVPAMVDGDEVRLAQIVTNLLNNASAYSPPGACVELHMQLSADTILTEIRDEGVGIPHAMLEGIFDAFVRGERSHHLAPSGLGLGLGISRALAELHGGSLRASSDGEGFGSVFRIVVPRLHHDVFDHAPIPTRLAPPVSSPLWRPRRILLVDDNADAADAMSTLLGAYGHDVLVTYGADQALAAAPGFAPHVAVLDIGLPKMDGRALAKALRQRLGPLTPALIALSGHSHVHDRERSAKYGFVAHLLKPVNVGQLLASIEDACAATPPCEPSTAAGAGRFQIDRAHWHGGGYHDREHAEQSPVSPLIPRAFILRAPVPNEKSR